MKNNTRKIIYLSLVLIHNCTLQMETSFVQGPGWNEGIMGGRTTDVPSLQDILTCEEYAQTSAYKGATGSCSQSIYELTVPTQPLM